MVSYTSSRQIDVVEWILENVEQSANLESSLADSRSADQAGHQAAANGQTGPTGRPGVRGSLSQSVPAGVVSRSGPATPSARGSDDAIHLRIKSQ